MAKLQTLDDVNVTDKKVLVRVDFNIPINDGCISNDSRIRQAIPTINELVKKKARVILISHLGRPKGQKVLGLSLGIVENTLRDLLPNKDVSYVSDVGGGAAKQAVDNLDQGQVLLLENLRYEPGEEANDMKFAAKLAAMADIYVNDAFSCAHRSHASVQAVTELLPSVAGRLMEKEIRILTQVLDNPRPPIAAVIGGSKISTKLGVLENLVTKVQYLIIGGAMANTFLYAQGYHVGKSFYEEPMVDLVNQIIVRASEHNCKVVVPSDVVVAKALKANTPSENVKVENVSQTEMILDVGSLSIANYGKILTDCRTIIWNGPLGAFEVIPFDEGTKGLAKKIAELTSMGQLTSVAGGGDTLAALEIAGVGEEFTYVSMAGGSFLEWLEGRELPGVVVLKK